jgi:hypothetical protein
MALAFRNLTITPDAPVSEWPTEAVQTALERGDLADWPRIVVEIGADPWGKTARQVEEVLSYSRPMASPKPWRRRFPAPVNEPRQTSAPRSPPTSGKLSSIRD